MPYKDPQKAKEYFKEYFQSHREEIRKNKKKYNNSPEGKKYMREYSKSPKRRKWRKKYNYNTYNKARMIVGKGEVRCDDCGCNDKRIVEINHINGGGHQERKKHPGIVLYRAIISGKRKINDLNLLCKVCNAKHCLELKYGKLPYDIRWNGSKYC